MRKTVELRVTLSLAPGVTKRDAMRELRSRVNEGCGFLSYPEEGKVRVRKVS